MLKIISAMLPFFVSLFWAVTFILNWKSNSRSQNIWGVTVALIAVSMGIATYYWHDDKDYSLYYILDVFDYLSTLSFVPFIYLYFRELTGDKSPVVWKMLLFFLPPVLLGGTVATIYLQMGHEQSTEFIKALIEGQGEVEYNESIANYQIHKIANGFGYSISLTVQTLIVAVYAVYRLLFYRKLLDDFFSNIEDKSMNHHWAVLWGMIALLALTLIIGATGYLLFIEYDYWVSIAQVLIGIVLYYICYHVSLSYYEAENLEEELATFEEPVEVHEEEEEEEETYVPDSMHQKILPAFNQVVDEKKLFLRKNLRVDDVATLASTNRTYISRILKEEYNCNFWTYINQKRIEYAKEQFRQDPTLTVETLFERCGFTHNTAFSRAFRQCEGITFREWQKNVPTN